MSFLDVFRSPGRRLTHEENAEIARRRGLIERESLPDRLKRLRREAETERRDKANLEAMDILPGVLEQIEMATKRGFTWWRFDRAFEQNNALALLLRESGLKVRTKGDDGPGWGWYYRVKLPR